MHMNTFKQGLMIVMIAIFVSACQPLKQLTQISQNQEKQTEALEAMEKRLANMNPESKPEGFDGHKWVVSIGVVWIAAVATFHWGSTTGLHDKLGEFLHKYISVHTVQRFNNNKKT